MKNLAFGIVFVFLAITNINAEEMPTLRVDYFNYAPHITTDKNGKPFGPLVEVWEKHLAPQGGFKIKWVGPTPFARMLGSMKTGETADVWAQLVGNKERFENYDFPEHAICKARQWIYVRKDDPLQEIKSYEDVKGKLIGKLLGGYLPPFMEEHKDELQFSDAAGDEAARNTVNKLLKGNIWGAYFVMSEVLMYSAAKYGHAEKIRGVPFIGGEKPIPCHSAIWKGLDPALKDRIKTAAKYITDNNSYDYLAMTDAFIAQAPSHVDR